MRTGNPALNENVFRNEKQKLGSVTEKMTVAGAVNRTAILLVLTCLSALLSWNYFSQNAIGNLGLLFLIAPIATLILAFVIVFKKHTAPFLAPIYCLVQGGLLGLISYGMEMRFPGIVVQAVIATFGVLFGLLFLYKTKVLRATENFKLGVGAATIGIAFIYLISFIASFFGVTVPVIHESTPLGIAFSVFVVVIAALNLVLDFDFIESGEAIGAPKYMEWYAAFGLMVTLIWLYLEILRLLAKTKKR